MEMTEKPNKRLVLKVSQLSVGAWYDKRIKKAQKDKPGPKPKHTDEEVLAVLKKYLESPIFYMEGYKKIKVRLQTEHQIHVGKERLRRIMSEHKLLCNQELRTHPSRYEHDGTITTSTPNMLWGMDIKEFKTSLGRVYIFDIIDHYNSEIKGWHISQHITAKEALEAIRAAVRQEYGEVTKDICKGKDLKLRVDHGSQFDSKLFEAELIFLGIEKSSAFVRSPQSNGVIERFHRTLKEQLFFDQNIKNMEEIKEKVSTFVERYNQKWLLHKLKLRSPLDHKKLLPSGNTEPEGVRH
jgi:transposase InsO family protein